MFIWILLSSEPMYSKVSIQYFHGTKVDWASMLHTRGGISPSHTFPLTATAFLLHCTTIYFCVMLLILSLQHQVLLLLV